MLTSREGERWLDLFIATAQMEIHPVSIEQLRIARQAHFEFGKGTGHGAGLNFGDCFSYALAMSLGAPLLFKGGDFAKTDVVSALANG